MLARLLMEDIQPQVVYPSTIRFLYIPGQVVCSITIFWNKKNHCWSPPTWLAWQWTILELVASSKKSLHRDVDVELFPPPQVLIIGKVLGLFLAATIFWALWDTCARKLTWNPEVWKMVFHFKDLRGWFISFHVSFPEGSSSCRHVTWST